ncbi:MAG: hypothetical protein CME34_16555 [Gordonia sp.]|uniref:hypothetical protein n=1 Tax=Gordonia sp. (in: high G+C Gram-positive bacteria) TaxID=84139 RepID=UPI000C363ADB|nr:hypothetical protein [Gordonia sp. (in: high G+C Gram-positive bacteria)]MAU83440.1 hypothetical protein [Gordonia sp. (in: high G+C Gram-positive bacteria)]
MSASPAAPARFGHALLAGRGRMALILVVSLLATCLTMWWSYQVKIKCGGAPFLDEGRSSHWPVGDPDAVIPCYSDLMYLWIGRDINNHVFPFIHGGITPDGKLFGGVVEYPVLSGMLMWLGAIGAHTDTEFFQHSVWLLVPFGLAITVMLALMTRWWVLLWAATPPLVLYAFHNWELPVVATAVSAVAVMAWGSTISPRTGERRLSVRTAAILAAILLGIGFCLKLYPGFFVLPLAIYVLTYGAGAGPGGAAPLRRKIDWVGAAWVAVAATLTVIAIQLPFMVLGFEGWRAALSFQGQRKADVDTNSIWYWGLRHFTGGQNDTYNTLVGLLSPMLIVAAFALAVFLGWRVYQREGVYPWIGVSASMLAGFMLFHKVHSPQYTLWILPFFVLLQVRWPVIAAYLIADFILDTTIFRLFGIYTSGSPMKWWVITGVNVGVWVHAVVLAYLIVAFVRAPLREPLASFGRRVRPPEPDLVTTS